MKKELLMSLVCCMATMAQAKIIRVSNVEGSTAPYKTFAEAYAVAEAGDTLLFDGSDKSYGNITIGDKDTKEKPIVLLGSGYDLITNGITDLNNSDVVFGNISVWGNGTIIKSVTFNNMDIQNNNVVVNRCKGISIEWGGNTSIYPKTVSGVIIHQNSLKSIGYADGLVLKNGQITNNIFWMDRVGTPFYHIRSVAHSVIHNNTFGGPDPYEAYIFHSVSSCSIKYNSAVSKGFYKDVDEQNEVEDNVFGIANRFGDVRLDTAVMEVEKENTANGYGAFAGTDPYVISGVPAGPVIEDIEMPVSVEKGKKLEVTVKVKIQK